MMRRILRALPFLFAAAALAGAPAAWAEDPPNAPSDPAPEAPAPEDPAAEDPVAEDPGPGDPEGDAPAGPVDPLTELTGRLDRLVVRLESLIDLANKDPRWRTVETYATYSESDFKERRRIKAEDLVDIMADADALQELREAAWKTLGALRSRQMDPDLERERGRSKPLQLFCRRHVVELLTDDDPYTRQFAHLLLKDVFFTLVRDPAIRLYDARNGTRKDWMEAQRAWNDQLK